MLDVSILQKQAKLQIQWNILLKVIHIALHHEVPVFWVDAFYVFLEEILCTVADIESKDAERFF